MQNTLNDFIDDIKAADTSELNEYIESLKTALKAPNSNDPKQHELIVDLLIEIAAELRMREVLSKRGAV